MAVAGRFVRGEVRKSGPGRGQQGDRHRRALRQGRDYPQFPRRLQARTEPGRKDPIPGLRRAQPMDPGKTHRGKFLFVSV